MGKQIALFFSMLFLLTILSFAQTNAWVTYSDNNIRNSQGDVVEKHVKATFTMDSLGVILLSKVIDLTDFANVNFETYPITFRFKTVSTYDSSATRIRALACFQSATDTAALAIDTIRHWNNGVNYTTADQIETDSTGILTFNSKFVPQIRIAIQALRADVNSGYLDLVFRKGGN